MLKILSHLTHSTITATDGDIGHVKAAFFDDKSWTIRYLVVNTETWLPGRDVLISPYSVKQPLASDKRIDVALTRQKVIDSPDIDTQQPVSRQHEREYSNYYAFPEYWYGGGIWGAGAYPLLAAYPLSADEIAAAKAVKQHDLDHADVHLRSSVKVSGYNIQATDDSIGHVKDFIYDDESWEIPYLVVDTRNWWPGGKKVLIASHWIDRVDWDTSSVFVSLTRAEVRNSPEYEESTIVDRTYEQLLHDTYNRIGYWDRARAAGEPPVVQKAA
ncbi:MAG: PRC-barrel domain containing protein [Betaproteobacteria bacterium]